MFCLLVFFVGKTKEDKDICFHAIEGVQTPQYTNSEQPESTGISTHPEARLYVYVPAPLSKQYLAFAVRFFWTWCARRPIVIMKCQNTQVSSSIICNGGPRNEVGRRFKLESCFRCVRVPMCLCARAHTCTCVNKQQSRFLQRSCDACWGQNNGTIVFCLRESKICV